jgi:hypothetical protein
VTVTKVVLFFRWLLSRISRTPAKPERLCYVLGFEPRIARGGERIAVSAAPAATFRAERLLVPAAVARHFQVVEVIVGGAPQFKTGCPVPASLFDERALGPLLGKDVARPSSFVTVTADNVSGDDQVFHCGVYGPVA